MSHGLTDLRSDDADTSMRRMAMNDKNQRQFATTRFDTFDHLPGRDRHGQGHPVQAASVMQAFWFGPFRVIPYARLLERAGAAVTVSSRAFDLLCILAGRPGEIISKGELMARTWPDVTVEESSLRFHIAQLRRALDDGMEGERYVVNVPGRGYCFVACVSREASPTNDGDMSSTAGSALAVSAVPRLAAV
jgi:DNA-binding winged helix-turn-helix (wHTH) protein